MVGSFSLYAQVDERTVKLSGNYHWGEGFSEDRESAISNAKKDLIERLIVRIDSETNFSERDTNDDYQIQLETTTNTMSRMELRGLNYLPAEQRRDGSWEAIAFISIADFNETMALEEQRLLSVLTLAMNDEAEDRLDAAIPQYMEILASTFYSPVPFYAVIDGDSLELRSFLTGKMRNWVNTLDIEVTNARSLSTAQNSEFYFDLGFEFNQMKTSHLEIQLNKSGYASHPIRNGRTSVFYDLPPESILQSYTFTISPIVPNTIDDEKTAILEGMLPIREVTLDIDFSELIDIDFKVTEGEDNTFTFEPEIKNLSVFSLEWDFGDGETSTETSPTYQYASDFESSIVSLILNSSADLIEKKEIGEISTTPDPEPEPEPVIDEFQVPTRIQTYIENTIRLTDAQSLTRYLNQLAQRRIIQLGRQSDVSNPALSYLAIVNPENRRVEAVLSPIQNGNRYNLITNQAVSEDNLSVVFRGKGSVWFQFN
jgi:hypothetical protein